MCPHGGSHHAWGFLLEVTREAGGGRQMLRDGRATGEKLSQPPPCCPQGWCPALSAPKPEPTVLGRCSVQPPEAPWGTRWPFCPRGLSTRPRPRVDSAGAQITSAKHASTAMNQKCSEIEFLLFHCGFFFFFCLFLFLKKHTHVCYHVCAKNKDPK